MLNFEPLHAQPQHHHHRKAQPYFSGAAVFKMPDTNRPDLPVEDGFTLTPPVVPSIPLETPGASKEHGLVPRLGLKLAGVTCHFAGKKHSWTA